METEINIELRKEILEIALNIEKMVSDLLILYLNIEKEDRKAISNKSSSLSFKNKIDLLFDLEVFSKDEYSKLLLIMEFRNQFLHNYDCNSFEKAGFFLGLDKLRKLLSLDKYRDENIDNDINYIDAYRGLHLSCIDDVLLKIQRKEEISKEKRELVFALSGYTQSIIDYDTDLFEKIIDASIPNDNDSKELISFKMQIHKLIIDDTETLSNSEFLRDSQNQMSDIIKRTIKHFK